MRKPAMSKRNTPKKPQAKRNRAAVPNSAPGPGGEDRVQALSEPFHFTDAAKITGVKFHPGEASLDGMRLILSVMFATHGARDGRKWEVWPHEARVYLGANSGNSRILLGEFRSTSLSNSIGPACDPYKPDSRDVAFSRCVSPVEMAAIEKWRDGRDLSVTVNVCGFGSRGTFVTWRYFDEFTGKIPRSEWSDMLAAARFLDHVHLAVPATADRRVSEGTKYLREALDQHVRGDYASVAQTCRKAVEEIGTAGFGQRTPKEVTDFWGTRQQREQYPLGDRIAIVLQAAKQLLHASAHAGPAERDWQRADADLALAITAALLQVAPSRLTNTEAGLAPTGGDAPSTT
jgi:hypothetical protein